MNLSYRTDREILDLCLKLAVESPCQKRGFGAILVNGENKEIIASNNNHNIDNLSHVCNPMCIRLQMHSGMDAMIGDCGHAEEHTMWDAIRGRNDISGTYFYVAGVTKPDNKMIENLPFYCLRCSTMMRWTGVSGVYLWADEKWNFQTAEQAYNTALQMALSKINPQIMVNAYGDPKIDIPTLATTVVEMMQRRTRK